MQFDGSHTSPHSYAYHAILPIKLWLLKANDPDRFALMDRLMDHNDKRINASIMIKIFLFLIAVSNP